MFPTSEFLEVSANHKRSKSSKFGPKVYEGFLVGYDSNSRAYLVFEANSGCVETTCVWCLMRLMALKITLLEKRFIRTPGYQYWCRLVTVASTNNGWLTSRYQ
jgi:hypothetical protein